jgi:hypothetical protein
LEQVETQKKNKSTEIKNQMAFSLVKKEKKLVLNRSVQRASFRAPSKEWAGKKKKNEAVSHGNG